MRRFQFTLQTLLELRELREREARRRVAAQHARIAELDRQDRLAAQAIERQQQGLLDAQSAGVLDPLSLQRGHAWIAHLRKTIAQRRVQRDALSATLRELRDAWHAARRDAQAIQKLRERRLARHRKNLQRYEQAQADELARQLLDFQPV
jgi:flagellar export protein FliJ